MQALLEDQKRRRCSTGKVRRMRSGESVRELRRQHYETWHGKRTFSESCGNRAVGECGDREEVTKMVPSKFELAVITFVIIAVFVAMRMMG